MIRFGAKNDVSVKCEVSPSCHRSGFISLTGTVHYRLCDGSATSYFEPRMVAPCRVRHTRVPVYHPFLPTNITGRIMATIPPHNRPISPAFPPLGCKTPPLTRDCLRVNHSSRCRGAILPVIRSGFIPRAGATNHSMPLVG